MKQLSEQMIIELGIEELMRGKQWAYVPAIGKDYPARLGFAAANEPGYWPVPEMWANGEYAEMQAEADRLNRARGVGDREAARIVASSMASGLVGAGA